MENKIAFLTKVGLRDIEVALVKAEELTSGEIRVAITPQSFVGNKLFTNKKKILQAVNAKARKAFDSMDMHTTKNATGVLIFISMQERRVIVLADKAINEKVMSGVWMDVCNAIIKRMKKQSEIKGICHAISLVGDILKEHFPNSTEDTNELPNMVEVLP